MMLPKIMLASSRLAPSLFSFLPLCLCVSVVAVLSQGCKREEASKQSATSPAATSQPVISTDLVALNNRGVGLMGKFEYENARQAFEKALALGPRNEEVMVNLAIATLNRQREGDEDRAFAILHDALQVDPANLRAAYCEGLLRLYLQSPEQAQPLFQKVAEADEKDAFAAYYLGQCFAQQRQYDKALEQYQRAIELDPHIRSAFYAASQANRALGKDDDAAKMLTQFQELERNPQAHLAEFKYTRMGKKGDAQVIDLTGAQRVAATRPDGPIFLPPEPLLTNGDQFKWKAADAASDRAISITACDIDHDGDIDIFIANCLDQEGLHNAVCVNDGSGHFAFDPEHVLATIPDVSAALWGDVDNDGFTDVYLCRKGPNMLWRQKEKNVWEDVTASSQTANGTFDSVDGALFDADHDGDLDIFVVNADGPNELFNNNLDGTFKPIAAQAGITGDGKGSRQVLPVDLDGDRDLDIIVINRQPPHDVWVNELAWNYAPVHSSLNELRAISTTGIVAADADANGVTVLYSINAKGDRSVWRCQRDNVIKQSAEAGTDGYDCERSVFLIDSIGEGAQQPVELNRVYWKIFDSAFKDLMYPGRPEGPNMRGIATALLDPARGDSVIAVQVGRAPVIWHPGPGRLPFGSISFTGKQVTSDNKQIRSNASGIGTHFAARIDSTWVVGDTLRNSSGPGQSLQPVAIGLGGHDKIDFLAIDWSDGVFQSEIDLEAGKHHVIEETQRQLSSCPVLFAWDGVRYRFITDLLGVGGVGYMTAPGEYAPSRPWENLLLPNNSIQARDAKYILKIGEPMEEACYLDAARLVAYDLPPGWDMTIDDRMNILGPEPTGDAIFYPHDSTRMPTHATNAIGDDVTAALRAADLKASPVGEVDERFIGLLKRDQVLTMAFDGDRNQAGSGLSRKRLALIIDGWIEYPYSQTMFAAWQANAKYNAPTLEMRDASGEWKTIFEQFGYPAGMPRQMAIPLPDDLAIDESEPLELRLRTNMEIYFDRIAIAAIDDSPQVQRRELKLATAKLADVGFPKRTTGPQRQPSYDYDARTPLWDTRHQRGFYTEFGRVDELLAQQDDALTIFGPGEEVELRYDASTLPPLQTGWTRRFVLEARGWCKDMDLYTGDGETIEPLPHSGEQSDPPHDPIRRDELHRRFNTRYEGGR